MALDIGNVGKGVILSVLLVYVGSGLYTQIRWSLYEPYRQQRIWDERRHKLSEDEVERALRASNAFGRAADSRRLLKCELRHGDGWDYACYLYSHLPNDKTQMRFGVMADSEHITQISKLYPVEATVPPPSPAQ
jgi:hypothetical protein